MLLNLVIGFIVGIGVVGCSVARTLHVNEGQYIKAVIQSALNSMFYFLSVYFITKNNYEAFIGTAIGSCFIVLIMAYWKSRKIKQVGERTHSE
jgi:protein-S-isoprenylcysteine O-methyltransferase Ste14